MEIPHNAPGLEAGYHRLQGGEHRCDDAFGHDLLRTRLINGDAHALENQSSQPPVGPHIRHHQGDIPAPASTTDQFRRLLRRRHGLLPRVSSLIDTQPLRRDVFRQTSLEQFLTNGRQRIRLLGQTLNVYLYSPPVGDLQELLGRLPGLFKGKQFRSRLIAVERHGNGRAEAHQVLQNGQILPGEVRKALYVEYMVLRVIAVLQLLQEPGHPVSGVPLALGAEAVVALHQKAKLLQLLGKGSLALFRGPLQILWRNAAALEFVYPVHQLLQEFRLAL